MVIKRKNTINLDFKNVRKKPPNLVLHKWIKETFNFNIDQVLCIQFDHIKYKVYIKLLSLLLVKKVFEKFPSGVVTYKDDEGTEFEIYVSEECDEVLVKIFDFPVELRNEKLKEVLSKYGIVKSIRNEKWSGEDMYNVENGVRLVNIIMKDKIPSYLTVDGITSLVTYKDQIRTCMVCEESGHERRDCPKRPANRIIQSRRPNAPVVTQISTENVKRTYAMVTENANEPKNPKEQSKPSETTEILKETVTEKEMQNDNDEELIIEATQEMDTQEGNVTATPLHEDNGNATKKARNKRTRKDRGIISSSEEERKVPKITIKLKDGTTAKEAGNEKTAEVIESGVIEKVYSVCEQ